MKDTFILAIESSCDETAASVVKNGRTILSNVISSQIALHTLYGGVVPEIASRKHIEKINQVIEEALSEANVTLDDLDDPDNELSGYMSAGSKNALVISVDADIKTGQLEKMIYQDKWVKVRVTVEADGTRKVEEIE